MGKKPDHHKKIDTLLAEAMHADRIAALRSLKRIKRMRRKKGNHEHIEDLISDIESRLKASVKKKKWRLANTPDATYPPALPITAKKDEIITAIKEHPVVIVSGETGSGKTTQIPKFCLAAGRGISGMIGCTQPRRIAATTVSHRLAEELGQNLGQAVGYKIRFKERTGANTFIKIMTDGILLAETQNDPFLNAYDTVIVDEAHERSLNIDFVLGILKDLITRRKDLKLIITSATIDTEKFSKSFGDAPVIEVSGRMYPVETRYFFKTTQDAQNAEQSYVESAVWAVDQLQSEGPFGDILVFMPTEQDIRECCETISGRNYRNTTVMPLFARLSAAEQKKVFAGIAGRKIIVATNVAETSITIPGIKYVVDSGLARIARYTPRYRITALPVSPISQSSANQRKGRCGRVANGICTRLFSEEDYLNRPLFTRPEILRSNLAEVILRMIHLKLGDIDEFPFIDRPADKSVQDGFKLLLELDAIQPVRSESVSPQKKKQGRKREKNGRYRLTGIGRLMAKLPLDPRLSKMIIEARERDCLKEIVVIASALSVQDPRERPTEKEQAADQAQAVFVDPQSDFITLLNIWKRFEEHTGRKRGAAKLKKFCSAHYLSFRRMREWLDVHQQIVLILHENGIKEKKGSASGKQSPKEIFSEKYMAIHKSILGGFLSNIAQQKEKHFYRAAHDKQVMLFPGSGLFKNPGTWIVAAEFVETSRLFARIAAHIDSKWLEALGGNQCRRTYRDPHWEKNRGAVMALEQISLYGLIIVIGRPVPFGPIASQEATEIFIRQALVNGDVKDELGFLKANLSLVEEIRNVEDKIRRRDILIQEEEIVDFYSHRLDHVYDIRTLKQIIKKQGGDLFLRLQREDLLRYAPDPDEIQQFPDKIGLGNRAFECLYQFEPGKHADGVTVKIPLTEAPAVDRTKMDWLVPGMLTEKITALIKGLPKKYRKKLVPVTTAANTIATKMPKNNGPLIAALSTFIHNHFGFDIPAAAWPLDDLPDHLKMRIEVIDPKDKIILQGRETSLLDKATSSKKGDREFERLNRDWEKPNVQTWDFGDLKDIIRLQGNGSREWIAYPGLATNREEISLRLFHERSRAAASHRKGVAALFSRLFSKDLKFLKSNLKLPEAIDEAARYFGGRRKVEGRIYEHIRQSIFGLDIRKQSKFLKQAETFAVEGFHTRGRKTLEKITTILQAYREAREMIQKLETGNLGNTQIRTFLNELRNDLSGLVPESFFELYDGKRMGRLPRYIRAVAIRAQRGVVNLEKDRQRSLEITRLNNHLDDLIQDLTDTSSHEKRTAVEDFFWLIQEYKVSVFAQELGTAVPVSLKKLERQRKDIERMV